MKQLEAAGYETEGVTLASVGAAKPLEDFGPDVKAIQSTVQPYVDQGKDVILVVHSYGGVIGSEAVQGLDRGSREKQGKKGGISHLYFCCAFVLPEGASLMDGLQGKPLEWFDIAADQKTLTPKRPGEIFYNDVESPQQYIDDLKPHSYQTLWSKLTYAGWKHVPCTYLYCLQDQAIPIHVQKAMVEGSGVEFRTDTLDASHSPFLSFPDEMTKSIRQAAGETI